MHETQCGPLRVHRMNRKAWFEVLTRWRSKNDEERMKNVEERLKPFAKFFTENVTETFRKRLGLDFLHGNNFSKQIRKREKCLRGWTLFFFTSSPIYSKIGEVLAAQLAQASQVASSRSNSLLEEYSGGPKWAWVLFAPPFLLSTPPSAFLVILFRKVTETYEFHNDTCFLSVMLRNLADYIIIPFLTYGMLRNLT